MVVETELIEEDKLMQTNLLTQSQKVKQDQVRMKRLSGLKDDILSRKSNSSRNSSPRGGN